MMLLLAVFFGGGITGKLKLQLKFNKLSCRWGLEYAKYIPPSSKRGMLGITANCNSEDLRNVEYTFLTIITPLWIGQLGPHMCQINLFKKDLY